MLDGFSGYLQSDGFAGYSALARAQPAITGVGCWAHARRKFVDVQKAQQGEHGDGEAGWFIERTGELYALERDLAEVAPDERYRRRRGCCCTQTKAANTPVRPGSACWRITASGRA